MSIVTTKSNTVATDARVAKCDWRQAIRDAIRDPVQLCRKLDLNPQRVSGGPSGPRHFGLFVPLEFLQRMRPGDWHDPLLRQVLPVMSENSSAEPFTVDPVGDESARVRPGLLQKYQGRALLVVTGRCAVHCRYCFRQHYPYEEVRRGWEDWQPALRQIQSDSSITEVLLSGGDPLTLGDARLVQLVRKLTEMPHLQRLRIHTRLPIVIPQRVTDALLACLADTRLTTYVVVHANHAQELDDAVVSSFARLIDGGSVVLNQSVLLQGVNDSVEVLAQLSEKLIAHRVLPYYLHQLDRVAGAGHFEVPESKGRWLVRELRKRVPGYAVPQYVREIPGEPNKTVLA